MREQRACPSTGANLRTNFKTNINARGVAHVKKWQMYTQSINRTNNQSRRVWQVNRMIQNPGQQKAWRGMNINVNLIARYGSRSVGWGI